MSAILGLYYLNQQPVDHQAWGRMMESLAHRGIDGSEMWHRDSVGLGHHMTWTTPESLLETLPLANSTHEIVLTADARIDNRDELIALLGLEAYPAEKITDSQIILLAYERWGEACPTYLLGDFAFAIWDSAQQRLFCARDHFGIKPFYYYHCPGTFFACATEIKAILSLPEVPKRPNELRIAYYLSSIIPDKHSTFYQEIYRLPPAHSLTVTETALRFNNYWEPDPHREIRYESSQEYADEFRAIFTEAVQCRLRSAFPVGFTLSGGLDSSSVVCTARPLLAAQDKLPLHTFSTTYNATPECDERPYIQTVIDQGGIDPAFIVADDWSVLHNLEGAIAQQDQPLEIRNQFMWQAMYGAAQDKGIRVMLDGEDGDTVVSYGQGYLAELAIAQRWTEFAHTAHSFANHFSNYNVTAEFCLKEYGLPYLAEMAQTGKWGTFSQSVSQVSSLFNDSIFQLWLNQGLKPLVPEAIRQVWHTLRGYSPPSLIDPLVHPDLAKRTGFEESLHSLQQHYPALPHTHRERHWAAVTADTTSWIEEESDRTTAAFGIEKRHPFWDRRLVEFCLAVPAEHQLCDGWPRYILRQAMTDRLPPQIQWREGKSNLGENFVRSLSTFEQAQLAQVAVYPAESLATYVNSAMLRKAHAKFLVEPTLEGAGVMWKVSNLAVWLDSNNF